MLIKIKFYLVIFDYDIIKKKYVPNILLLNPKDLKHYEILIDGKQVNYDEDLFANVTQINMCYGEEKDVTIKAILHKRGNDFNNDFNNDFAINYMSDFNNDFNNDFGSVIHNEFLMSYKNSFKVYGYDLEFPIYLVSNNNADFNNDFNEDFAFSPKTYSNFNLIRKPYSNELWIYDNTSSKGDITYEIFNDKFNNRNIVYCYPYELDVKVKKELFFTNERRSICGCDTYKRISIEDYVNIKTVNEETKYLANPINTYVVSDVFKHNNYLVTNETKNTHYVNVDYNLTEFTKNDVKIYPIEKDILHRKLYSSSGYILLEQIDEITDFDNYTPIPFDFTVPFEGDYLVETILTSYICDKEIRKYIKSDIVKAYRPIEFIKNKCELEIHNHSFEDVCIKLHKLNKTFDYVLDVNIQLLNHTTISLDDGVYRFTYKDQEYIYVNICNAEKCLEDISLLIMNNKSYQDKYSIIITLFNMLIYKLKTHNYDVTYNYYINNISELFSIDEIINRLQLYCYECGIKKCGCSS